MIKKNTTNKIIIITFFILIFSCFIYSKPVYSVNEDENEIVVTKGQAEIINVNDGTVVTGDASKGLPNINDGYKPEASGEKVKDITNTILGYIMVVGAVFIVVFIAITGFGMIMGSSEEKAIAKEKFIGYVIAAILLTSGVGIAKLIISVASQF